MYIHRCTQKTQLPNAYNETYSPSREYMCKHKNMHTQMKTYIHTHKQIHIHTQEKICKHQHIQTKVLTGIPICRHKQMSKHTHAIIHTYKQTHINTQTHTNNTDA